MDDKHKRFLRYLILVLVLIILGYLVSLSLWNKIILPFSNPYFASGKLAQLGFNPINNQLRWAMFVTLPSILFLVIYTIPYFRKLLLGVCATLDSSISNDDSGILPRNTSKYIYLIVLLIALVPLIVFLGKDFSTANFDMFHEGEQITPALNYLTSGGIWTRTLFVHGALYDVFTAFAGWKLFGVYSIGAYRIMLDLLKLLVPVSLVLVLLSIWGALKKTRTAALITTLMALFYAGTWRIQNIDRRDVTLLIGLSFLFWAFTNRNRFLYFCSGLLSAVGFYYSFDIGVFYAILLVVFPIILAVFKAETLKRILSDTLYVYAGILVGFLFFYALVGHAEFSAFIANMMYFIRNRDLIDSYVYPFPNMVTSFRFTLPILISTVNLLIFVVSLVFLYLKNPKLKSLGIIHSVLTFISLLHYRSALGRSDLLHIETNSSLIFLTLGFNAALVISLFFPPRFISFLIKMSTMSAVLLVLYVGLGQISFRNIFTFRSRVNTFLHEDSLSYVNKDRVGGIKELRQIFSSEKCVLSLTSEAAIPYLLNKPSCGPLYISYFASAEPVRSYFLSDLKKYSPQYVLFSTKLWTQNVDSIPNESRFPEVISYVENNYTYYRNVSDYWVVYVRK